MFFYDIQNITIIIYLYRINQMFLAIQNIIFTVMNELKFQCL